jgi:hypothetical protein
VKLNSYDVRTGKMGLREVNDFRVGSILIDDAASFGVTTRQLLIEILCNCAVRETGRYFNPLPKKKRALGV